MIYFDNAATSFPKPTAVADAVRTAVSLYGANPGRSGHSLALETGERVFACREAAADVFGLEDPARLVFTANCTESLNFVIKGTVREGCHVVISSLEHNAAARPVYALAARRKISFDVARVYPGESERTLDSFRRVFRPNTRLCVCTMGSNVFGTIPPYAELGELCRLRGVLFCVDAAQSCGLLPFDFPWDYACAAGHKGLYGPTGVGLLAVRGETVPLPTLEGGTGSLSSSMQMPDFLPDSLESGTLNTVGILGLQEGIRFVQAETPEKLYSRELELARYVYGTLAGLPGISLYTPRPALGCSLPVLAFNIRGIDSEEAVERLSGQGFALRGGFHCAPLAHRCFGTYGGAVRFSPGAFNTLEQARLFTDCVREMQKKLPGDGRV